MQGKISPQKRRLGLYLGRHAGAGGGIAVYALELLRNYISFLDRPETPAVELVVYAEPDFVPEDLRRLIAKNHRIRHRILPGRFGRKPGMILDLFFVSLLARWDRLDLLHCAANYGVFAPGAPQLITVHDLFQAWPPESNGFRFAKFFYRALFSFQLPRADHLVVDAPETSDDLCRRLRAEPKRITTIPLGLDSALVDFRRSVGVKAGEHLRRLEDLGLRPGYTLVLGSSDPRKNVRRAICSWSELPEELKARGLVVKWNEEETARVLEELVPDPVARRRITVLPWVSREDVLRLFLGAGVSLIPSLREGFGFPALEAASLGCPVVTPELHCLRSIDRHNIYPCDPNSVPSIARATEDALRAGNGHSPAERAAGVRLESFHTMEQAARDTFQLSLDLISRTV